MEREQLEKFVKDIKNEMTSGPVCDSLFQCEGWKKGMEAQQSGVPFKFCPWCGK